MPMVANTDCHRSLAANGAFFIHNMCYICPQIIIIWKLLYRLRKPGKMYVKLNYKNKKNHITSNKNSHEQ
jgi:hypothetical protein